ncbi:MAG: hypothetical protein AAB113_08540 [Candidatus Eisenbacteria bacterium]
MMRRGASDWGLAVAGILTCGMALYHFWLPIAFRWGDALAEVPMLHWGLFIINACFSYLLLAGGAATIAIALEPGRRERAGRWVLMAMAGCWLFNGAYQVFIPMPLPQRMAGLRWGFLAFPAVVVLLYGLALARRRAPSGTTVDPSPPAPGGIG